jgi:hypothetical protein
MIPFKFELVRDTLCAVGFALACPGAAASIDSSEVRVNGEPLPFDIWHTSLLPGETLDLDLPVGAKAFLDGTRVSSWQAPAEAGIHELRIQQGDRTIAEASIFVLEPSSEIDANGALNGYKIGTYPRAMPQGFIRLDSVEDYKTPISPSFQVGQFICKQQPNHFPKYVLVSAPNLQRSEALLESLRADGLTEANTFFVMSGFRTPFYNTAIGSAKLSRHMYGDAFDIYLDVSPRDGVMDDLNGDGRVTKADANFLYDYAAELFSNRPDLPKGGIGAYGPNSVRGPFVHVDGRGRMARWGR